MLPIENARKLQIYCANCEQPFQEHYKEVWTCPHCEAEIAMDDKGKIFLKSLKKSVDR